MLGLGVGSNYPRLTVNFLKEHNVRGNIFNDYNFGGYLIYHLWPNIPLFIDGRTPTIYDQNFLWLYFSAQHKKEVWKKLVDQYGVEIVLIEDNREHGYSSLFYWLDEDRKWMLVAFDDVSCLYIKRVPRFEGLTKRYGFRYLRPALITMEYAKQWKGNKKYLQELEGELNSACQRFPNDFYPFYYLGIYYEIHGTRNNLLESEKAMRKAIANRPDLSRGYYELGFILMKLERYDEAVETLKKAIKLQPNLPVDAYYYLGVSLYNLGYIDEAVDALEKYRTKADLETRVEAYRLLGNIYIQKYKFHEALSCFERERYLEEPTWETFSNLGLAYFGLDRFEEARKCFERARAIKPGMLRVVYNLAVVYEKLGLFGEAKRMYAEASKIRPQTPEEEILIQKAGKKAR
jgi:tetratricopeptide (TPR) repeat protein